MRAFKILTHEFRRIALLAALALVANMLLSLFSDIHAESPAEKAKAKRAETLHDLVFLDIPLKNFGDDDKKNRYNEVKKKYAVALAFFFEESYVESYRTFLDAQTELDKLYEEMSALYIDRTGLILQDALQQIVDVEIKYNKNTEFVKRFLRDREAPKERPLYDPKDFHLVYDKYAILDNIDRGYELLGISRRASIEAQEVEKVFEPQLESDDPAIKNMRIENRDPKVRRYRIDRYKKIIENCRQAKLNAANVFQLMHRNRLYLVQKGEFSSEAGLDAKQGEFNQNYYVKEKQLDPIFDPRIPDKYKIDASDAKNRWHEEEIKMRLNNENIEGNKQAQK